MKYPLINALPLRLSPLHSTTTTPTPLAYDTTGSDIILKLNEIKSLDQSSLWNSTLCSARYSTKEELFLLSKQSFDTNDYLTDLITQTKTSQDSYQTPLIALSVFSLLFTSLIIPQLALPIAIKNTLGLIGLFGPLALIGFSIISPDFRLNVQSLSSNQAPLNIERISYHEAGHLLAGYLLGIPILSYDIKGEKDAGTTISTEGFYTSNNTISNDLLGALLVVSMSGVVAETLRFGRSQGGSEDFALAYSIMRETKVPVSKREGYLRWAAMQALLLLQKHRDSLDGAAAAMRSELPLLTCFAEIDNCKS
jgi:hypothetical protein